MCFWEENEGGEEQSHERKGRELLSEEGTKE